VKSTSKTRILFLVLFLCITSYGLHAQDAPWTLSKNKNGIKVYTRPVEGYKIKQYKAVMELDHPIEQVSKVIQDIDQFEEWFVDISDIQPAGTTSEGGMAVYMVIDTPFPVQDRDLVVVMNEVAKSDSLIRISTHSEPDFVEIDDDYVRMPYSSGEWLLESIGEGRTKLTQTNLSDPGGSIPTWVINMMLTSNPMKTFGNLRDHLESLD
jgi:hypothetical protein